MRFWNRKDVCGVRLLPVQQPFYKEALLNEESYLLRMEQAGCQYYQVITVSAGDTKLHCRRSAPAGGQLSTGRQPGSQGKCTQVLWG